METRMLAGIKEGDRRREDYGDIGALAASIGRYGLLQPIVLDDDGTLVAGGRRLRAVRQLGWLEVPVRLLGSLSETERRKIELEENVQRKGLTPYELDRKLVKEAKEMAARMLDRRAVKTEEDENISTNLVEINRRGRKSEYGVSKATLAEALGTSKAELVRAEQRVAAVEAYPELEKEPQSVAIGVAKAIEAEPERRLSPIATTIEHYRANIARPREQQAKDALPPILGDIPVLAMASAYEKPKLPEEEERFRKVLNALLTITDVNPEEWAQEVFERGSIDQIETRLESVAPWVMRLQAAMKTYHQRPMRAVR